MLISLDPLGLLQSSYNQNIHQENSNVSVLITCPTFSQSKVKDNSPFLVALLSFM